jgi:hypothetical protein
MDYEWLNILVFFFSLLTLMMLSGMPVAIGFLTLNIIGLYFFMRVIFLSNLWWTFMLASSHFFITII